MSDQERQIKAAKAIIDMVQRVSEKAPSFDHDNTHLGEAYDVGFQDGMIVMARIIKKLVDGI